MFPKEETMDCSKRSRPGGASGSMPTSPWRTRSLMPCSKRCGWRRRGRTAVLAHGGGQGREGEGDAE